MAAAVSLVRDIETSSEMGSTSYRVHGRGHPGRVMGTMAIIGAHTLLYSSEPDKLRAVLRDAFGLAHVDVGHGWLIFTAPPSEIAVHPADADAGEDAGRHQLTFMCDDIVVTVRELRAKGIVIDGDPQEERWGI